MKRGLVGSIKETFSNRTKPLLYLPSCFRIPCVRDKVGELFTGRETTAHSVVDFRI